MPKKKPDATAQQATACIGACAPPPTAKPALIADPLRAANNARNATKWLNEEVRYMFVDSPTWKGSEAAKRAVVDAFKTWLDVGIGVKFVQTKDPADTPKIRIGFSNSFGATTWSKIGRQAADFRDGVTMNFSIPLDTDLGKFTALHEVGHALGFAHEHQNPRAPIEWNTTKVRRHYEDNERWPPNLVNEHVLDRWSAADYGDWAWDPDSVMNYRIPSGLIKAPAAYAGGLSPPARLSPGDRQRALHFYPPISAAVRAIPLQVLRSHKLDLTPDQQAEFEFVAPTTRKYSVQALGGADAFIGVYEALDGHERFLAGDDSSGVDTDCSVALHMVGGRRYLIRARLHHAQHADSLAVVVV